MSLVTALGRAQIITTVAGGSWQFRGDGKPAVDAPLGNTAGVAVDAAGNVYATDTGNNLVVKVSPSGILTVVAGNGFGGFSGDGGPATSASLSSPVGLVLDAEGTIYVTTGDSRVRKISQEEIISTVAGIGRSGFSGDDGPATQASFSFSMQGLAVDPLGNLYIADTFNYRVRMVTPNGIITTVAGNGQKGFSGDGGRATNASLDYPAGLAVDAAGNLYIADANSHVVRKVSRDGIITTIAGVRGGFSGDGGPATSALFANPQGVAVDSTGSLYIADSSNHRVRKVSPDGIITTIAGNGVKGFSGDGGLATQAALNNPRSVAIDSSGNVYIGEYEGQRIRKVSPGGIISTVAGNAKFKFAGDGGPAASSSLNTPMGIAAGTSGSLYIADTVNQRIRKVSPSGIIGTVAGTGVSARSGDGMPATSASIQSPTAMELDSLGNLYFVEAVQVRKISPAGILTTGSPQRGVGFLLGFAVDTSG